MKEFCDDPMLMIDRWIAEKYHNGEDDTTICLGDDIYPLHEALSQDFFRWKHQNYHLFSSGGPRLFCQNVFQLYKLAFTLKVKVMEKEEFNNSEIPKLISKVLKVSESTDSTSKQAKGEDSNKEGKPST
jgi:hypothetical protein